MTQACFSLDPFQNGNNYQSFRFYFRNDSGTFIHNISNSPLDPNDLGPDMATAISGASATLQNTPSGNDATTDFVAGVKISSAVPNRFIFDTADLEGSTSDILAVMTDVSIGKVIHLRPSFREMDVNGDTRNRLVVEIFDDDRNAVDINSTNFPAGKIIEFCASGWMPAYS